MTSRHVEIKEQIERLRSEQKVWAKEAATIEPLLEGVDYHARHGNPVDQKNAEWLRSRLATCSAKASEIAREIEALRSQKGRLG